MPRILIFGSGGIGTVYGYLLNKGGAEVTAVCRSSYEVVKANGFTINSKKFGNLNFKPEAVRSPADAPGPWDFIVVTTKSMPCSEPSQAEIIKPAVGRDTTIVLLQNGIGIEDEYAKLFPSVIVHKEHERLQVGTFPADNTLAKEKLEAFAAIMKAGGSSVEVYDDIQTERWSKLVVNASWNPITALSRSRDAYFLRSSPEAADMVRKAMLEVASVAQAAGYQQIDEKLVDYQLNRAKAREIPGVEPSMMADALHGRALEVEAIIGNTIKIAKQHLVETPILTNIYVLIKALDDSFARDRGGSS